MDESTPFDQVLRVSVRFLGRFFWGWLRGFKDFLVIYEALFVGYSTYKLLTEGVAGLLAWWAHLQSAIGNFDESQGSTNWGEFVLGQLAIAILTVVVLRALRRHKKRRVRVEPGIELLGG